MAKQRVEKCLGILACRMVEDVLDCVCLDCGAMSENDDSICASGDDAKVMSNQKDSNAIFFFQLLK